MTLPTKIEVARSTAFQLVPLDMASRLLNTSRYYCQQTGMAILADHETKLPRDQLRLIRLRNIIDNLQCDILSTFSATNTE